MPKSKHRKNHKEKARQYKSSLKKQSPIFKPAQEFVAGPEATLLTSAPHWTALPGAGFPIPLEGGETLDLIPGQDFVL